MCGFGEKDRRPIDPPPIVQLILDEPNYNELKAPPKPVKPIKPKKRRYKKSGRKGRKPSKKALAAAATAAEEAAAAAAKAEAETKAAAKRKEKSDDDGLEFDENNEEEEADEEGSHGDGSDDGELYELDEESEGIDDKEAEGRIESSTSVRRNSRPSAQRLPGPMQESSTAEEKDVKEFNTPFQPPAPQPKRRGRPARNSVTQGPSAGMKHDLEGNSKAFDEIEEDEEQEWPRYEGGRRAVQQDPLYVLHVSLWSEDGSEVRSMIATPGQSSSSRLTRILMGAVVVSPILLDNEHGEPGWYFSFPDLSIRTEGVYKLKFSLMRFTCFDVDDLGGSQASTIIAEETSEPFTVFSAKKFPGMTESTELSKAFAKQGLKIPIRNDLRTRKNTDKD
ncbi:hypothetical protein BGZ54_005582 [Gamsiella multidivaricata]|nr:hypothetical protein BGZ54_005582 [Gamsiella multidivaricata]